MERHQVAGRVRKRRNESNESNERLSKRMSLLNIEHDGEKLYVPVEAPLSPKPTKIKAPGKPPVADDNMQLDDSKHKVYIYNIDDELSDSDASDDGKLVFLPDIEKHLFKSRIPPSVLANSDGELAGQNQLVLYSVPSSLSVPESKDSVRKAIIEARARARNQSTSSSNPIESPRLENHSSTFTPTTSAQTLNATPIFQVPLQNGIDNDTMDLD